MHHYWSIVENTRVGDGRVVQRHVLYLGEINASQEQAWRKGMAVFEEGAGPPRTVALFPEDRCEGVGDERVVRLRLSELRVCRPRQWGACWVAVTLWRELGLDRFWCGRLPRSRKGTRWDQVLFVLTAYRWISPGSEWRLHREWFDHSALPDLLGSDRTCADIHTLYACHDRLLEHKHALFDHVVCRWRDLFNASFEILLYDLTSTSFECEPPKEENAKRRFGDSRDTRSDCVQVIIALVVTPEGFPIAYDVLPGNTADNTTLRDVLRRIEQYYGKARRIWVMDRGIPTEEVLKEMRDSDPPVAYLVGTPKGRLNRLEKELITRPWHEARSGVHVNLRPQEDELSVYTASHDRVAKERAMRTRNLTWRWARLKQLCGMTLTREQLLMKLGAAQHQTPAAWRLVQIQVDEHTGTFTYRLNRQKRRQVRRREGRYLLRTNLTDTDPVQLWNFSLQLVAVEEACKNLKHDLARRPISHQLDHRIEAHLFIAFLAYCLHVTLGRRLDELAPGLTARSALEKFSAVQMIDVHIPTTDGRELRLTRYTQPEPELRVLLNRLKLELPDQPPPTITAAQATSASPVSCRLWGALP